MNEHYKFENTPLPYPYDAMEPYIDTKTMELHQSKHLQSYVDQLNQTLKEHPRLQRLSLEELIVNADRLPRHIETPIRNNAGGVYNHRFFFQGLKNAPPPDTAASGPLSRAIAADFGSMEQFKKSFKAAALSVFGSGYAWLTADRRGGLNIIITANQNTPLTENLCPVLTIDVWEHAYYLKYQNRRSDYIDGWFRVINWENAAERYAECRRAGTGSRL